MSIKNCLSKNYGQIRLGISAVLSLTIAAIILWGLIPVFDPEAELTKFNVKESDGTVEIELNMLNRNYFRGFNYTTDGWLKLFYLPDGDVKGLDIEFIEFEYQGFKKPLAGNFSASVSLDESEFASLKTQESHIYVALYLVYRFKILLWTTQTKYYQWLGVDAYLNNGLKLKDGTITFERPRNLTLAISS